LCIIEFNDRGITTYAVAAVIYSYNWTQFVGFILLYYYYYVYIIYTCTSIGVNLFYLQFLFQRKMLHPTTVQTIFTTFYIYIISRSIMTWCLYSNCISVANRLVTFYLVGCILLFHLFNTIKERSHTFRQTKTI